MSLTAKQKAFVAEYMVDLNSAHAALRAGYSEHTAKEQGCRLLKHPAVGTAIAEAMANRASKVGIDAAWVLEQAVALHTAAIAAKAFPVAARALELVGKHIDVQAFKERVEHGGRIEYSNMSDEELDARITALTAGKHVPGVTTH